MSIFTKQGEVSTTGTVIHVGQSIPVSTVLTLRFFNASAYVLTLERYSRKSNTLLTIYELTLSAGDQIVDTTPYILETGDYLKATSDIVGTNYFIEGQDS
jgi:hypothetical protein